LPVFQDETEGTQVSQSWYAFWAALLAVAALVGLAAPV